MTAITLPEIDRSTIDDLRTKMPNLSELELPNLPSMQHVGKTADQAIDRLLGRSRPSVWPWIAVGVGMVAVIGAIAAYFRWFRQSDAAPIDRIAEPAPAAADMALVDLEASIEAA